ncbi:MAG: tRNA 2-thiouridine(34) synthase MnmA [bacterium]
MSGGVDSSVAAALLKKQGFGVVGVFMKNWTQSPSAVRSRAHGREEAEGSVLLNPTCCTTEQDFLDMRAVCQHLDIPYYTFNFEQEYKKRVLDYFFAEYKAGRTPNPDVMCNKEIKFDLFLNKALALGADFIATGHYAQKQQVSRLVDEQVSKPETTPKDSTTNPLTRFSTYQLLKGNDPAKDQTYFLYNLTQAQLGKTLFPIGKYPKKQVRILARRFKLPTAEKKDSQGICFIGQVDVKEFLKTALAQKPGRVVDMNGKVIGEHEGAWFYTIGQRRVAGLAGQKGPLYVVATDIEKNLVIVGPDSATYGKGVILENLHLIDPDYSNRHPELAMSRAHRGVLGSSPKMPKRVRHDKLGRLTAKPRYGPGDPAGQLIKSGKKWQFIFDQPERALTPGQSLVIYNGQICLGGGVIRSVTK